MQIKNIVAQLRTTDLQESINFYKQLPGFELAFRY